jgi:hypothetical protein
MTMESQDIHDLPPTLDYVARARSTVEQARHAAQRAYDEYVEREDDWQDLYPYAIGLSAVWLLYPTRRLQDALSAAGFVGGPLEQLGWCLGRFHEVQSFEGKGRQKNACESAAEFLHAAFADEREGRKFHRSFFIARSFVETAKN